MDIEEYRRAYQNLYAPADPAVTGAQDEQPMGERRVVASVPGNASTDQLLNEALKNQAQAPQQQMPASYLAGQAGMSNPSLKPDDMGMFMQMLRGGALGVGQGLSDMAISGLNLPATLLGSDKKIPHLNLGQYTGSSVPEQIAFYTGSLGTPGGAVLKGAGALSKALPYLKNLRLGKASMLKDALLGAGTGYALGETDEKSDLGRYLGGALGGVAKAGGRLTSKNISNRMLEERNQLKKAYEDAYNALFKQGKKIPQKNLKRVPISPTLSKEFNKSQGAIARYLKKPTLKNAHVLQSDLGKDIRSLGDSSKLPSEKIRAKRLAMKTQRALQDKIKRGFASNAQPDLALQYGKLSKGYKKNVVPYLDPTVKENLDKFQYDGVSPSNLLDRITSTKNFQDNLLKYYPEVAARKFLGTTAKLGLGASGLYGLSKLFNKAPDLAEDASSFLLPPMGGQ